MWVQVAGETLSGVKRGEGKAPVFGVRQTTWTLLELSASKVAVKEHIWDTWSCSSAGFSLSKQRAPVPDSAQPASPRSYSGPSLRLELPPSRHQSRPTLSEALSVYSYRKGAWVLTGFKAQIHEGIQKPKTKPGLDKLLLLPKENSWLISARLRL